MCWYEDLAFMDYIEFGCKSHLGELQRPFKWSIKTGMIYTFRFWLQRCAWLTETAEDLETRSIRVYSVSLGNTESVYYKMSINKVWYNFQNKKI